MAKIIKAIDNLTQDAALFLKIDSYYSLTPQKGKTFIYDKKTSLFNTHFLQTTIITKLLKRIVRSFIPINL